jgi:hypothetical protein
MATGRAELAVPDALKARRLNEDHNSDKIKDRSAGSLERKDENFSVLSSEKSLRLSIYAVLIK